MGGARGCDEVSGSSRRTLLMRVALRCSMAQAIATNGAAMEGATGVWANRLQ